MSKKPKTKLEMREQMIRHREETEAQFKADAPKVKEAALKLECPLTIIDLSHIYRWIFRKQIMLNDLPESVLIEFK